MDFSKMEQYALENMDEPSALTQLYVNVLEDEKLYKSQIDHVKKLCLDGVERYLTEHQMERGESPVASFGITRPTPSVKVDEKAWDRAVAESPELAHLQAQYDAARSQFEVDATGKPRPYIKGKKL